MKRIFIKASDKRFKYKFIRDKCWPKDRILYVQKIKRNQIEGTLIQSGRFVPRFIVTFIPWEQEDGTDHDFGFEMLE